jgi:hypothetical protein
MGIPDGFIDLFDKKVIVWSISKDMTAELTVIKAKYMGFVNRPIKMN